MSRQRTFKYSANDVAEAIGKPVSAVRRDIREGRLDIESLVSVSMYIVGHKLMRGGNERSG
jgi:DNA-directed RNA polymerase specialized sigma24 family protein